MMYEQFKEKFFKLYRPDTNIKTVYIIVSNGKILVAPNHKYIWQSLGSAKGAITRNYQQKVFGMNIRNREIANFVNQMIEDGIIEFVPVEMIDDSQES